MTMYHIQYLDVPNEKQEEFLKLAKEFKEGVKEFEGAEPVGLFFPRGSGFWFATITKCRDYATWEKWWRSPAMDRIREKAAPLITKQVDRFFDEIEIE